MNKETEQQLDLGLTGVVEIPKTNLLKKMPDPEMLEEFLGNLVGKPSRVVFDLEKGEFEWIK